MIKTNFVPSKHGFHFKNDFVNPIIDVPLIGNYETYGRCGGMAYAALDYYFAKIPIPTHKTDDFPGKGVPPDGSKIADYIYQRLIDSFLTPSAFKFVDWTISSDRKTWLRKGVTYWTKNEEFPKLCKQIDQGIPVVLGLIGASNLSDVGNKNHQVVAYGYDYDASNEEMTVYIYDNNSPDEEVVLTSDKTNPHFNATNRVDPWRGFFVQDYSAKEPV